MGQNGQHEPQYIKPGKTQEKQTTLGTRHRRKTSKAKHRTLRRWAIRTTTKFREWTEVLGNGILGFVFNRVIFWAELNCWRKSYSSKATLLLGWNHPYKNSTAVITNWLIVTQHPFFKRQKMFYLKSRCILSPIIDKIFSGLNCE